MMLLLTIHIITALTGLFVAAIVAIMARSGHVVAVTRLIVVMWSATVTAVMSGVALTLSTGDPIGPACVSLSVFILVVAASHRYAWRRLALEAKR